MFTSEAEYIEIMECVQDLMFVNNVLEMIGIGVANPVSLFVDTVVAIFIARNGSTKGRKNHMYIGITSLGTL